MGAVEVSKTMVNFYQTAQCSTVEDTVCHRVYFFWFYVCAYYFYVLALQMPTDGTESAKNQLIN